MLNELETDASIDHDTGLTSRFQHIISDYKQLLRAKGLSDELYKWELINAHKGKPNLHSNEFTKEILSVKYSNLIYKSGVSVMRKLCTDKPEEYRTCLNLLFDEKVPLEERIARVGSDVSNLYRMIEPDPKLSAHHDERTLATILTFYNPEKYALYKDSFYQRFCDLVEETPKQKNEKYVHYLELLDQFISPIKADNELLELVDKFKTDNSYADPALKILAQDILYTMLEKHAKVERSYWRIGTSDGHKSYWSEMSENSIVSIGWPEIGDLSSPSISNKGDVSEKLTAHGYYLDNKRVLSKKAGEIFDFYSNIKIGDVILAQQGFDILGIGIASEAYVYDSSSGFPHQIGVRWIENKPAFKNPGGKLTTVFKVSDKVMINEIDKFINLSTQHIHMNDQMDVNLHFRPKNQILYGPPGTGKTYQTINRALAIIEGKSEVELGQEDRQKLKNRYKHYVDQGQIVFTTFHQSMSYEDFIEGIKPLVEEDEEGNRQVVYEVQDGIFKNLVRLAGKKVTKQADGEDYSFDDAWNDLITLVEEKLENKQVFSLPLITLNKVIDVTNITSNGNLKLKPKNGKEISYTISYIRARKLHQAFPDLSLVKNIDKEFRAVIGGANSTAYWSVLNFINNNILRKNKAKSIELLPPKKPYVLIIDEINRGNVSAIFGELITLIEESKRAGSDEALEVVLPYSKQRFSVPGNLYIIGTMNTADRSVEALDTALRRRFAFQEMLPNSALIGTEGALKETGGQLLIPDGTKIDIPKVHALINRRIRVLLDSDHQIGHSYFMQVKNARDLADAFKNCIIPLLQEYFYHDEEKIALVLGEGFVGLDTEDAAIDVLFPRLSTDRQPVTAKAQYKFKKVDDTNISLAISQLIGNYA